MDYTEYIYPFTDEKIIIKKRIIIQSLIIVDRGFQRNPVDLLAEKKMRILTESRKYIF